MTQTSLDTTAHALPHGLLAGSIFSLLDAHDLACASQVCKLWRQLASQDKAANQIWQSFYSSRWKAPSGADNWRWCFQYGHKMKLIKSWQGKYHQEGLWGHKAGIRCCKLLPSCNLLATGSLDRTVRLWDLSAGTALSVSGPHPGTVRCLALDPGLLASGSTDGHIRVWLPCDSTSEGSDGAGDAAARGMDGDDDAPVRQQQQRQRQQPPVFDLQQRPRLVRGHTGPVSALCVAQEGAVFSGSWDLTVRLWDRATWSTRALLSYDDWVWAVAARGGHLLVSAGAEVHVHDLATLQAVRRLQNLHEGHVCCLEGSHNGRMLFTGSGDGRVIAHDLRMKEPPMLLWHHKAGVHGLAFEDPWLVSASADGTVVMHNTEAAARARSGGAAGKPQPPQRQQQPAFRQLQAPGGPAFCVDIAEQWMACGSEAQVVRVWDFTRAAESAERAAAARAVRGTRKARKAAAVAADAALYGAPPPEGLQQQGAPAPHYQQQQQGAQVLHLQQQQLQWAQPFLFQQQQQLLGGPSGWGHISGDGAQTHQHQQHQHRPRRHQQQQPRAPPPPPPHQWRTALARAAGGSGGHGGSSSSRADVGACAPPAAAAASWPSAWDDEP